MLNPDFTTLASLILGAARISIVIKTNVFNILKKDYKNLLRFGMEVKLKNHTDVLIFQL